MLPLRMAHIVWFRQLPVQTGVKGEFFVVSLIYVCMGNQVPSRRGYGMSECDGVVPPLMQHSFPSLTEMKRCR